jgi:hypothetical protein
MKNRLRRKGAADFLFYHQTLLLVQEAESYRGSDEER